MNRRTWIKHIGLGSLAITASGRLWALEKITRSDNDWQQLLSEAEYYILRDEGTEPPGTQTGDISVRWL